jgi:peptidyl-prolyl cis-trans isomerase A (cyclophilin A)
MNKLRWAGVFALVGAAAVSCNKIQEPAVESEAPAEKPADPPPKAAEPAEPVDKPAGERTADGYEVIRAKTASGESTEVEVKAPEGWQVAQPPTTPDPRGGKFTLKDALKDLPGKQPLVATIRTNLGTLYCDLFDDKAPTTVANFVGLARGLREVWSGKDKAWVTRPYYDGTTFHRVIPGFMIQGGDWKGDGSGNLWYSIPDEVHPSLKHDRAGLLCMANRGPNTNEGQFFITEGAAPHLDGSYSIFGQCIPTEIVNRIARVPQSGAPNNRPLTPVVMERVTIERRAGGANAAAAGAGVANSGSAPAATAPAAVPPGRAVREDAPKAEEKQAEEKKP